MEFFAGFKFPILGHLPFWIRRAFFFAQKRFFLPHPTYNHLLDSQGKEHSMETNRVLSRIGARTLSDEEIQQVAAGFKIGKSFFLSGLGTGACNYDPVTCRVISGDCADNPPPCFGQ
jgi:hypothetical protein